MFKVVDVKVACLPTSNGVLRMYNNAVNKNYLYCGEDRFDRESVFMAVSYDPHIMKTLSPSGELHFEILYYLVYVLTW